jgi:hypothetical protein
MHCGPSILWEDFEVCIEGVPPVLVTVEVGAVRLLACI